MTENKHKHGHNYKSFIALEGEKKNESAYLDRLIRLKRFFNLTNIPSTVISSWSAEMLSHAITEFIFIC